MFLKDHRLYGCLQVASMNVHVPSFSIYVGTCIEVEIACRRTSPRTVWRVRELLRASSDSLARLSFDNQTWLEHALYMEVSFIVYSWENHLSMMDFPLPCFIAGACIMKWKSFTHLSGQSARVISDSNFPKIKQLIHFCGVISHFLWVKHRETIDYDILIGNSRGHWRVVSNVAPGEMLILPPKWIKMRI